MSSWRSFACCCALGLHTILQVYLAALQADLDITDFSSRIYWSWNIIWTGQGVNFRIQYCERSVLTQKCWSTSGIMDHHLVLISPSCGVDEKVLVYIRNNGPTLSSCFTLFEWWWICIGLQQNDGPTLSSCSLTCSDGGDIMKHGPTLTLLWWWWRCVGPYHEAWTNTDFLFYSLVVMVEVCWSMAQMMDHLNPLCRASGPHYFHKFTLWSMKCFILLCLVYSILIRLNWTCETFVWYLLFCLDHILVYLIFLIFLYTQSRLHAKTSTNLT